MEKLRMLTAAVLVAERGYSDPAASEEAVGAAVDAWGDAMAGLAASPAQCAEGRALKARALQTAFMEANSPTPTIQGDRGLAASLIRDVLAAAA